MEFEKVLKLIKAVSESDLTEFKLEEGDTKLSFKADRAEKVVVASTSQVLPVLSAAAGNEAVQDQSETVQAGNLVSSPLVGTFYSSQSPEADAFVAVGDRVKKGQTLGIVEAMKLMNEIECEYDGEIAEIMVENGQMVEYGQPLFRVV